MPLFFSIQRSPFWTSGVLKNTLFLLALLYPIANSSAQIAEQIKFSNTWPPDRNRETVNPLTPEESGELSAASHPHDSAIIALRSALKENEHHRDSKSMIESLRVILPLLNESEREDLLARLIPVVEKQTQLQPVRAILYNARAKGYQSKGQYEQAGAYYLKAIALAKKHNPEYLATVYNNYGSLLLFFRRSGDTLEGLYYLDKAQEIAAQNQNLKIITCVLCNKGKAYRDWKQYDTSLVFFMHGLKLAQQEGFLQWEFVLLNNIGDLYFATGRPNMALTFLKTAIEKDNETLDPYYRNMAATTLGEVYAGLGNYEKAEGYWLRALDIARRFQIGRDLIELNRKLAGLYIKTGNYKKAMAHQLHYTEMKDSLMGKEIVESVQAMELKYRVAEKDKELLKHKLDLEIQATQLRKKNTLIFIILAAASFLLLIGLTVYSRFRQKQKLFLRDEQIREMKALLKGEEQERIRLAQDLHDGIGGMLAAVNMNMHVAQNRDFKSKADLNKIMGMIQDTSEEVRKTSHNLMPSALLRKDLKAALLYYFDYINKENILCLDLNTSGISDQWRDADITIVFRIVQELVQNTIKHASATHIIVSIEQIKQRLNLIVEDNGVGFNPETTPPGFGLEHLDFRIKALRGDMAIRSAPGAGTSVTINLNLGVEKRMLGS